MLKSMYLMIGLLLLIQTIGTVSFDVTQIDKHGVPLNQAKCNKDTVVDFNFSPDSMIANCTSAGCQVVSCFLTSGISRSKHIKVPQCSRPIGNLYSSECYYSLGTRRNQHSRRESCISLHFCKC